MCIRISPNQKLLKIAVVFAKFATIDLCPKGSGYDNHLESLVKIPSSLLYEKKDGAFELTSLPPHPHVLLAFK